MAFRLIPKEEKFFEDFVDMAVQIDRGAALLEQMLAPDQPIWDKADEIKEVEHKCDFLTHEVIQRLHKTFVTPLDREDIHALARSLDDVIDAIDDCAGIVRLYQISKVRPDARDLSRIIRASTAQVVSAMKALGKKQGISGLRRRDQPARERSRPRPPGRAAAAVRRGEGRDPDHQVERDPRLPRGRHRPL